MASPLFNMLAQLTSDPEKLEDFQSDPKKVMRDFGVDEKTIDEMVTNDDFRSAVRNELDAQFGGDEADFIFC